MLRREAAMPLIKTIVLPVLLLPLVGCGTPGRQPAASSDPPRQVSAAACSVRCAEIQAHCVATTQATLLQTERLASCFQFAERRPGCCERLQ
jgi:hypothetical protein